MSYLITGGTGYLGRALARRLTYNGWEERVCIYSRSEAAQAAMQREMGYKGEVEGERLRFFVGDVRDLGRLERAMRGVRFVIHAAALKRIEVGHYNPDEMVKTNVLGTMNVIEAARRAGVARVVLVSSDKAFQPVSPYGLSKALAEHLCLAANRMGLGPSFVVVRYGNVAGSTGSVIPMWRDQLEEDPNCRLRITDPGCTRFWMRIEQAVDLVLDATGPLVEDASVLVPKLPAYQLQDLAIAMGGRAFETIGLPAWEKKHEAMEEGNSSEHAERLTVEMLRLELARMDLLPRSHQRRSQ